MTFEEYSVTEEVFSIVQSYIGGKNSDIQITFN